MYLGSYSFTLLFLILVNGGIIGIYSNFCVSYDDSGNIYDLSPLKLSHGYYTGSFFDNSPNSFNFFFNICGNISICSTIGDQKNYQACLYYPVSGQTYEVGKVPYTLVQTSIGINYTFTSMWNASTIVVITCQPTENTLLIEDCTKQTSGTMNYFVCNAYSRFACPLNILLPDKAEIPLCTLTNENGQRYYPYQLQLSHGYYSATFFSSTVYGFNLYFNICGFIYVCNILAPHVNYQSCVFYPFTGNANEGGFISGSYPNIRGFEITEIPGGLNYQYSPTHNSTTNIKLLCDPDAQSLDIFKGNYTDFNGIRNYQVYSYTKYACPDFYICTNDCSNNGNCTYNGCKCFDNWYGDDCSIYTASSEDSSTDNPSICFSDCSGNGICAIDGCKCDPGWSGIDCAISDKGANCVSNCSNRGECLENNTCKCYGGWVGDDCSIEELAYCTFSDVGVQIRTISSSILCFSYNPMYCKDGNNLVCQPNSEPNSPNVCQTNSTEFKCTGDKIYCASGVKSCEFIKTK